MIRSPGADGATLADIRSADLAAVRSRVVAWYAAARRDLPWRMVDDPYAILVSEVMLQQTQVSRVVRPFSAWMGRFPTVSALASAGTADVIAAWSGLGYNRRALALRRAAAVIARDGWPREPTRLEELPGVGPYTARAIASLAFGMPVGPIDTNVRRWLVRRFPAEPPRDLQALADRLAAGSGDAAAWTQASIELGAVVCRSRAPLCSTCPIRGGCPSRDAPTRVAVARQAPYRGSERAYRGTLLRLLAAAGPPHGMTERDARRRLAAAAERVGPPLDDAGWERLVGTLRDEGLLHRRGRELALGGERSPGTIAP